MPLARRASPQSHRKKIAGSNDGDVKQDENDRLESVMVGDQDTAVAQDASTGELLSEMTGSTGDAIKQDSNGRLESLLIGSEGIAIDQEADTGKGLMRLGGDAAQADIDVGTSTSPHDLTVGDFDSGNKNAGGAQYLSGKLQSSQGNTFTITINWLNDNDDTTISSSPAALTDVSDVEFNLIMRSDRFQVTVTDTSGNPSNDLVGTVNAH